MVGKSDRSWKYKLCRHQDRYGIEILVESLFRDGTASWVLIVNGVNIHVTETTETTENTEHRAGKPVAKARPRLKPAVMLSSVCIPVRDRKWIDINPEKYYHACFSVDGMEQYDSMIFWGIQEEIRWCAAMAN